MMLCVHCIAAGAACGPAAAASEVPRRPCDARAQVVSVADGMPSWVCEVCVHMPSVREGIEYVKRIEQEIVFPIKPLKA